MSGDARIRPWLRPSHRTWPEGRLVLKGEVWLSRLAHPSWWPRLLRGWLSREWLWRRQGCPTDMPVVLEVGQLHIHPDGRPKAIAGGWYFDFGKQTDGPVPVDDLWHWLAVRYPSSVFVDDGTRGGAG